MHGTCVGAGVELAALAGRVVAEPGTTFRLPEIGMGLVPGAGGTVGITRRIGRWRCLHLALAKIDLPLAQALGWRLIDDLACDRPCTGGVDGRPPADAETWTACSQPGAMPR